MKPLIEVRGLSKSYVMGSNTVAALRSVSLTIGEGEFVAIMGASGSGKSTFMNILGFLDHPTSGEYLLDGRSGANLSRDELAEIRNQKIGFVFQGFNLLNRMNVLDNVALPLIYGGTARADARAIAQNKLSLTGLGEFSDRLPNQLSGGQQQRVAIARALVMDPPVLLADEPTGNLDTATSNEIMTLIQRLNKEQNITVILVTHESDIAEFGQRLVRLKDGRVVFDGDITSGLDRRGSA